MQISNIAGMVSSLVLILPLKLKTFSTLELFNKLSIAYEMVNCGFTNSYCCFAPLGHFLPWAGNEQNPKHASEGNSRIQLQLNPKECKQYTEEL